MFLQSIFLNIYRELKASFNKIASIAPEIGKLKRLKRLILNSNCITSLPTEIGRLEALEELILSENQLETLPVSISNASSLRVLKLQNNSLISIPGDIVDIIALEDIDCSNNPQLRMIPQSMRGDTASILFICRIHRGKYPSRNVSYLIFMSLFPDYQGKMEELMTTNNDLSKHSQFLEQEQLVMRVSAFFGRLQCM